MPSCLDHDSSSLFDRLDSPDLSRLDSPPVPSSSIIPDVIVELVVAAGVTGIVEVVEVTGVGVLVLFIMSSAEAVYGKYT